MRRRILVLAAVLGLVATACSSGHGAAAPPTTTATTRATTADAPPGPNPDVIPPVITPAYVDAVFKVLNHVYGNATRSLVTSRQLTPLVERDLRAIFSDPLYADQVSQAMQSLSGPLRNVRANPGDAVTTVKRLIGATRNCVFVETTTDLNDVLIAPTPLPASEYYELTPKQRGVDPDQINPTPWAISFNADYLTPTTVANRCAG